jgi:hypothetical protein
MEIELSDGDSARVEGWGLRVTAGDSDRPLPRTLPPPSLRAEEAILPQLCHIRSATSPHMLKTDGFQVPEAWVEFMDHVGVWDHY